jgi:hypothetical protein
MEVVEASTRAAGRMRKLFLFLKRNFHIGIFNRRFF